MKLSPFQIQGLGLSRVLAAEAEVITVKRHPALQYVSWSAVNHPAQRDALLNNPHTRVVLSWVTASLVVVFFGHDSNNSKQFFSSSSVKMYQSYQYNLSCNFIYLNFSCSNADYLCFIKGVSFLSCEER